MIDTDKYEGMTYNNDYKMGIELEIAVGNLLAEVKRLREIIQVQIVTPRSKDFFFRHYGKDDFEERWKEWVDKVQDKFWGLKE
jgi:hypothetical protein|tara:strand:- start:158 stop:406 length:249 start_codon:yes stop_codon:yes gene_type:complete